MDPQRFLSGKRYYIHTFGCQMNENDSERLAGLLSKHGAVPVSAPEISDIMIVNTCAVREKSVDKVYSLLGRLKRFKHRNQAVLGVAGCVAQLKRGDILRDRPFVDFVIGPHNYHRLPQILREGLHRPAQDTQWSRSWHEIGEIQRAHPASAFVTVMEGCNNFCSYCVVPFTRGREKFRPARSVLKEAADLAKAGYGEIQLLGQNVDSYRDPESGRDFADLLKEIDRIEGLTWIRFLTSHPRDLTRKLAETMANARRICRQLHLPIQAGSDSVLRRMNRGYSSAEYLEKIEMLREMMPEIALSTDIIVGFPGENDSDFRRTLEVLNIVRYTNIFSFRYSPRPRTRALEFDDDVPLDVKRERLIRVQRLQRRIQTQAHRTLVGRTCGVLCTGRSKKDQRIYAGRNQAYQVINFSSPHDVIGRFVSVKITGSGPYSLRGEIQMPLP